MRIFIFDDEPDILEALITYMSCKGNELYGFIDYKEAIKFARDSENKIDVAIVDGAIDGYMEVGLELSSIIRSRNPNARIIILTGFSEMTNRELLEKYRVELKEKPSGVLDIVNEFGCI